MVRLGVCVLAMLLLVTNSAGHWQQQHGANLDNEIAVEKAIMISERPTTSPLIPGTLLKRGSQSSHIRFRRRLSQFFAPIFFSPVNIFPGSVPSPNTQTVPATAPATTAARATNAQAVTPVVPARAPLPAQQPRQAQPPAPDVQQKAAKARQQAAQPEPSRQQQQDVARSKAAPETSNASSPSKPAVSARPAKEEAKPSSSRPLDAQRRPRRVRSAADGVAPPLRAGGTRPVMEAAAVGAGAAQQQDPVAPDTGSSTILADEPPSSQEQQSEAEPPQQQPPSDWQVEQPPPYCIPNKAGDVFAVLAAGDSITQGSVPSTNRNWPYAIRLSQLLIRKLGIYARAVDAGLGGGGIFMTGFNNPTTFPPFINSYLSQSAWNVAVVMIGINDLLRGGKPALDIMGGLTPIVTDIIDRGIPVVLVPPLSAPGFVDQNDSKERERKQLATLMRTLAAQHAAYTNQQGPQIYLLDAQAGPLDFYSMPQAERTRYLDDGLHLTQYGYDVLGELVFHEINSHLCEQTA